jgi:hypothetical protein
MKFIRRPDLDISTRFTIALKALSNMGEYGYITHLAETYKVSRTFIYSLVNSIVLAFYLQFYSNLLLKRQFFLKNNHWITRFFFIVSKGTLLLRVFLICFIITIFHLLLLDI